jgi:S1-C subfamily serine protease
MVSQTRKGRYGEVRLQFDAPVSHGSSGGPILAEDGTVVGVVMMEIRDSQNLNFGPSCTMLRWLLDAPFVSRKLAR